MAQGLVPVRLELNKGTDRNALKQLVDSVEGFRVRAIEDTRPAELLIYEVGIDLENEVRVIQSLLNLGTVREVFVTSHSSDPALIVQMMRIGAREFFPQPIQENDVRQALERFKERRELSMTKPSGKSGQIINVVGSKGGVGTTTVAVNLATSLAQMDRHTSVALIDMNLLFGEVPLFLDIEPNFHWGEIARNIARLDATFLMSIIHKHSSGIFVLPSPSQLNGQYLATPAIIDQLLSLMRNIFDFIVVDSGQTMDDVSMKILEMADAVLLVAILSLPCLANVNRLLKLYYDLGYPQEESLKIVVNRYIRNSDVTLKDAEQSIHRQIYWTIPNDFGTTMAAINQGKVLSEVALRAPVTRTIRELAASLSQPKAAAKKSSSLFGWKLFNRT